MACCESWSNAPVGRLIFREENQTWFSLVVDFSVKLPFESPWAYFSGIESKSNLRPSEKNDSRM